jgi:hypothetical protein
MDGTRSTKREKAIRVSFFMFHSSFRVIYFVKKFLLSSPNLGPAAEVRGMALIQVMPVR